MYSYWTTGTQTLVLDCSNTDSTMSSTDTLWFEGEDPWNTYEVQEEEVTPSLPRTSGQRAFPPSVALAVANPFHRPLYGRPVEQVTRRGRCRPWTGSNFCRRSRGKSR